jgi:hypothetical protein
MKIFDHAKFDMTPHKELPELEQINEEQILPEHKEFAQELICSICQCFVKDHMSCSTCEKLFCDECAKKIYKCPFRCENFIKQPPSPSTLNLINKIKIKCVKNESGCNEILFFKNYFNHLEDCDYIKFKCDFCDFLGSFKKTSDHTVRCPDSFQICKFCGFEDKKKKFTSVHDTKHCLEKISKNKLLLTKIFSKNFLCKIFFR